MDGGRAGIKRSRLVPRLADPRESRIELVPSDSTPLVSVVVCTRNRSTSLADSLAGLLAMDYPSDRWELLVVDNASTDDTLEVAQAVERENPDRVRVVEEREIGLSAARNAAIRVSEAEIIAFIDDDAVPAPGWLAALVGALSRPGVLCAGGPVRPEFEGELPDWFAGRLLGYLSIWDKGDQEAELVYNEYPRGTNVAFRREAFERFGGFSTKLGRKGKSLLSGEETEICLRIERSGGKILYVPGAGVRHVTPAERVTPAWMARRFQAQGRSEAIINWGHAGLRGLRRGLRMYVRNAIGGRAEARFGETGRILALCQRRALRGYVLGMLEAPFRIRRYRSRESEPPADWLPFE
jgi:GT2 family glycosyltransferase